MALLASWPTRSALTSDTHFLRKEDTLITVKDVTALQAIFLGTEPSRRLSLSEFDGFLRQIVSIAAWKEPLKRSPYLLNIRDRTGQGGMTLDLEKALPTEMMPILSKVAEFLRCGMPYRLSGAEWILFGAVSEAALSQGEEWGYRLDRHRSGGENLSLIEVVGYPSPGIAKMAGLVQALGEWQTRPIDIQAETRKWIAQFNGVMGEDLRPLAAELPIAFAPALGKIKSALTDHDSSSTMDLKKFLASEWHLVGLEEGPHGEIGLTMVRKDGGAIIEDSVETGLCANFDSALFFGALVAFAKDRDAGR